MIIQKYCSKMSRYLIKFEHYEICIARNDLGEKRVEKHWHARFLDYISEHDLEEEDGE